MTKNCPRCHLPAMEDDDALNARSHDGTMYICSQCGKIESLKTLDPMRAHYLEIGQRRAQAALYGLDEKGNPKIPKEKGERQK